jgi:hypothetical protein
MLLSELSCQIQILNSYLDYERPETHTSSYINIVKIKIKS